MNSQETGVATQEPLSQWIDFAVLTVAFFLIVHDLDAPNHFANPIPISEYAEGTGRLSKQIGSIILLLYGVWAFMVGRKCRFTFAPVAAKLACAFYALIVLSLFWSASPGLSLSRCFGLTTYIVAAAGALRRLGATAMVRWWVFTQTIYFVAGLLNELRWHTFHPLASTFRFQGLNDGNNTGSEAAILILASYAMLRVEPGRRQYLATTVLGSVILLMTRSRTALISLIVSLLIVSGIKRLQGWKLALYVYGLLLLLAFPFLLKTIGVLDLSAAVTVGRQDASQEALNGREPLWTELLDSYVGSAPILGYGYGAFWTSQRVEDISADQNWNVAAAHSIYLDAVLALGMLGGTLYVAMLLGAIATSLKFARQARPEGFFFSCVLVAMCVDGITDSGPWYIASMYLFCSIQALFSVSTVVPLQRVSQDLSRAKMQSGSKHFRGQPGEEGLASLP